MLTEIITIGDEILIGQVVDTNSAWLAQQLNLLGIGVKQITSVSDNREHILNALQEAEQRATLILVTGGLGPTKDDITKQTICEYFKTSLRFDEAAFEDVKTVFATRNLPMLESNRKQAEVPESCTVIRNTCGTAPGMWFEKKEKIFVFMPGVPFEMKTMFEKAVLPKLQSLLHGLTPSAIFHKTILTQGIGESFLADKIKEWEDNLPSNIKLAYLPSPGMVRLRLSAFGADENTLKQAVQEQINNLIPLLSYYIYGYDDEQLEELVGKLLSAKQYNLATAESCTGGYIAHLITTVAGSSGYFKGSVIAYSNQVKENILHVDAQTLAKHGAVSEQTVLEMAAQVKKILNTDCAIAVSGIAGPTGGSDDKPVGTVWIAVSTPKNNVAKKFAFGNDRKYNIRVAALTALNMLRKELEK